MDRIAGTEGILEIAPEEARVVQQMFEWVDQDGLSARRVLNRLNELKIPPQKGAAQWAKSSVLRILHCETYTGIWHYNKFQGCEPKNPASSPRYRKRTKCSVRQRPRSEWIPLALPESLQIVPRERWQRVQQQLAKNLTFSPRNEKHRYLLKGLVRCGGCGARYTGDPCHGKYYYRCIERCKRNPRTKKRIKKPHCPPAKKKGYPEPRKIAEPLGLLKKAPPRRKKKKKNPPHKKREKKNKLDTEEQRILDAYRQGFISPTQLGQQLEKVTARRTALDLKRAEIAQEEKMPAEQVEKAVIDYCAEAAKNLANFTFDQWQEFLRTIIQTITFHGDRITIQGRIPIGGVSSSGEMRLEVPFTSAAGR